MNGPAAPKDPEKKRPYFYIMKDKEIFGAKQEDGSAIHFVYESDGRLINSAQIVGNITDENMLRLLETVEGFGKLVLKFDELGNVLSYRQIRQSCTQYRGVC